MRLLATALTIAGVGSGWLALIKGWGVEPQSWPWIIGSTVGGLICLSAAQAISERRK